MTTLETEAERNKTAVLDEDTVRDAKRWRFMQEPGYFQTGPYDSYAEWCGYKVGIQKTPHSPLGKSVLGQGKTLAEAIDAALASKNAKA